MRILITGANGFIGKKLTETFLQQGSDVVVGLRRQSEVPKGAISFIYGDLSLDTDFQQALVGIDVVIHLAALAHVKQPQNHASLELYRKVNTTATIKLANQAAMAGVKRFIFLSSIGVNGNYTDEHPFVETDKPTPHDAYAISKLEAEKQLFELASNSSLDVVILRPPLIYGQGARGSFATLVKLIKKIKVLPLGSINNKRAMLALDNLVDFISLCIVHPKAANEVFIISDDNDISTTEFIRAVANALGVHIWLIPVSSSLFKLVLNFLGKRQVADSLFSSLELDITKAKTRLEWQPNTTIQQQLKKLQQRK